MNLNQLVPQMIRMMEDKLALAGLPPSRSQREHWEVILRYAQAMESVPEVKQMLSAWNLQMGRENGNFHLAAGAAFTIWDKALQAGRTLNKRLQAPQPA